MMGTVRSINPTREIENFLNFLYGEEEAYVHLPLKNPDTSEYSYNHFFRWPFQREEVINHITDQSKMHEVFITPGMFKSPTSSVTESHGTYVAWADFDGNIPSIEELNEANIPHPTLRVQSSVPGREHWYWRYDQFNTDIASIQGINRALSYALNADIGAWDAGHSLRPVGAFNHKRGAPVTIKSAKEFTYLIADFEHVPVPKIAYSVEQFRKEHIPSPLKVLAKGHFPDEVADLVTKPNIKQGSRSSALASLAYLCCEAGLDNSQVYSILQWKDKHWKKFTDRPDKERYYVDLINFCRQKVPYEGIKDITVLADELEIFGFREVLEHQDNTKWIIDGLLPEMGVGYIVGRPGSGKTTLAMGLSTSLALNKPYLDWKSTEDRGYRVLFLSLEMLLGDVNDFYSKLETNFSEEEKDLLQENFKTYAAPEKVKFYQAASPILGKFLRTLENYKPEIILVDSASFSLASNLSNQEEVTSSIELLDKIRERYGCAIVFVHHSRKEPPGHGYKEADLDDVFGSAFIAASASAIISLKQNKDYTESNRLMDVKILKARFMGDSTGFSVIMDGARRMFRRPTMGALPPVATIPEQDKSKASEPNESFFKLH